MVELTLFILENTLLMLSHQLVEWNSSQVVLLANVPSKAVLQWFPSLSAHRKRLGIFSAGPSPDQLNHTL